MNNKRVVDTYSYQEIQAAMRDPNIVGMREHHKNGDVELVLKPLNYPYKNNLNVSYQEVMTGKANTARQGDYDEVNVNSEELIDFNMAKYKANQARIAELDKIIEQEKTNKLRFNQYENNPLYRAAHFDWIVNGNRQGLDQFFTDERAREEMIRQSEEAQKNRDNALEIAQMNKQSVDKSNEIKAFNANLSKLNEIENNLAAAEKKLAKDPGNGNLQQAVDNLKNARNSLYKQLYNADYIEQEAAPQGEGKPVENVYDNSELSANYLKEIQNTDSLEAITDIESRLAEDSKRAPTDFKEVNTKLIDKRKELEAKAKAANDRAKAATELRNILNGEYDYSEAKSKRDRVNKLDPKNKHVIQKQKNGKYKVL